MGEIINLQAVRAALNLLRALKRLRAEGQEKWLPLSPSLSISFRRERARAPRIFIQEKIIKGTQKESARFILSC